MTKKVSLPFLIGVYIALYLIQLKISLVNGSDDTWFANASETAPYFEWIRMRYTTWSGRLFPDTMLYVLLDEYLWIWRLLNPLFLLLLSIGIIRVTKKEVTKVDVMIGIVVLGYISNNILNAGIFWITGSMNYLWPIALGITAMIPFMSKVFEWEHSFSGIIWIMFYLFGIITTISNEQVALSMSAFSIISLGILYFRNKTIDIKFILLTLLILTGTSILIFAPGNHLRWESEVESWFPGYDELTLKSKIHLGIIWLYKQLFTEMRNILILLSMIISFHLCKRKEKK
ncbi:DUF6056 family protein [Neobacillus sp. Marseille-QA0830]